MSIKLASAALDQLFISDMSLLFMNESCYLWRLSSFFESLINRESWSSLSSFVQISFHLFPSILEVFQVRRALSIFSEDRMFLTDCEETGYSPASDTGHPGMTGGSDRAHLQGRGAGELEHFIGKGRGQQPLEPPAEKNNVDTRALSQGR